ncbi:arsenate reductase ArsC [Sporomusa sp.]|uniref:arsenate reductase ArsC n=1 Tax=Sporomusa sp. TaxID=2078658 RepID=UPI002B976EE3|nr:arsenate reductase ArsC [Sporomusa sp.]HWR41986.1 arsenate reductase ArsC [Sporomusa sp.]
MSKTRVIILCTHNSARSQMAEAFFKKYGDDVVEVHSAGFEPREISPYTIKALHEVGIDSSGQRSKTFREFFGKVQFGFVITVCKKAEGHCPVIFPGVKHILSWPFDDPAQVTGTEEEIMAKFREVRQEIEEKVKNWLAEYRVSMEGKI